MAEHFGLLPTVQGWLGIRKMSSFFKKWGLVFVLVWLMVYSRDLLVPCVLLGGEAPTVPVCCHSLGKGRGAVAREEGDCPVRGQGQGVCPCMCPQALWVSTESRSVWQGQPQGTAGRLQGPASRVVQTRCCSLFPFPITRELLLLRSHGTGQRWVFPSSCCCD